MIISALVRLAPGVGFTVNGDDYSGIIWPNNKILFTEAEVMAEVEIIKAEYKIKSIERAIQSMLDAEALIKGYDDMNSCGKYCGYVNSYRSECEALCKWGADCWEAAYALLAEWNTGNITEPSVDDVINQMPAKP